MKPTGGNPSARRGLKILLALASVLLALGLCEVALRVRWVPQQALWRAGDERWWQDIWLERRRAVPRAPELTAVNRLVVYSPTLGWRPSPGVRLGNFSVNSRGVRGAKEYPYGKAPGERRIVVIGDSYTFAHQEEVPIHDGEVYTARLEQALSGVSVINMGVPGYGSDQMLLYLREEGFKYHPDLVMVALYVENLQRSLLSFRDYAKPWFELAEGRLVLRGVPVPSPEVMEKAERPVAPRSYLWTLVGSATRMTAVRRAPLGTLEVDRLNLALLDTLREEVGQHESNLLVVVIPPDRYGKELHRSEKFVDDWGRRTGVRVLLLRHSFSAVPPDQWQKLFVDHWTPFGHQVAAAAIHNKIVQERLLAQSPTPQEASASRDRQ